MFRRGWLNVYTTLYPQFKIKILYLDWLDRGKHFGQKGGDLTLPRKQYLVH